MQIVQYFCVIFIKYQNEKLQVKTKSSTTELKQVQKKLYKYLERLRKCDLKM